MKKNVKNKIKLIFICMYISMSMFQLISYANNPPRNFEKVKDSNPNKLNIIEKIPELKEDKELVVKQDKKIIKEYTTNEGFIYKVDIPMPKEHQEYLYNKCKERDLDYFKTLAIISLESNFDNSRISKANDYGYMQINKINHNHLSRALKTGNKPQDPYVNINWGTYMLEDLYFYWKKQGISENASTNSVFSPLDKYAMSSYNKGIGGFKKYGIATRYINLITDRYNDILKLQ